MTQAAGYRTPRYLTFKQALELGGNVRKGDANNAILAAVGYNFRRLIRWLRILLRIILAMLCATSRPQQA